MNGDILTDIDYSALLEHHRQGGQTATIAAHEREVEVTLGVMELENGADPTLITGYVEKPVLSYVVSMGVYCFSPRVREHIPAGQRLDLPDLVLRLIASGEVVRAWRSEDQWLDIGRHDDYEQAQDEFSQLRHRFLPDG
jgi:NDP-sugar pyrophosphorylase family protein